MKTVSKKGRGGGGGRKGWVKKQRRKREQKNRKENYIYMGNIEIISIFEKHFSLELRFLFLK